MQYFKHSNEGKVIRIEVWTGPKNFQEDEATRNSGQSGHERDKGVSPKNRPHLPHEIFLKCSIYYISINP